MCPSSYPSNFTHNIKKESNWLLYTNKLIQISKAFQMQEVLKGAEFIEDSCS